MEGIGNTVIIAGDRRVEQAALDMGLDAICVLDHGREDGSTDWDRILVSVKARRPADPPTAIPVMDREATDEFVAAAKVAGVPVPERADIDGIVAISGNMEAMRTALSDTVKHIGEKHDRDRDAAIQCHLEALGVRPVMDVAEGLVDLDDPWEPISTGIDAMDRALDGGLPSVGLVVLGAISSAGKTSLVLQVADHIAEAGRPVLFVSCEQSARELTAKSISRLMMELSDHGGGYTVCPASDILRSDRREQWSQGTQREFERACRLYMQRQGLWEHVWEPAGQPRAADIRARALALDAMSRADGRRPPVVIVDYLQLLAPPKSGVSDKQAMDANVAAMRQLARDLRTCVIAISALNRASYSTGVSQESFRESSSIEYSADLLLGMQPSGMDRELAGVKPDRQAGEARGIIDRFKSQAVRDIEVKVLKNRMGGVVDPVRLKFYCKCGRFVSDPGEPQPKAARVI